MVVSQFEIPRLTRVSDPARLSICSALDGNERSSRPYRRPATGTREARAVQEAGCVNIKLPQTGGCQCGKIRYEVAAPPHLVYACHCTECQRATSSAFSIVIVVPGQSFGLSGIELTSFQRPASGGRTVTRWSCPECGTWICGGGKNPRIAPPDTSRWIQAGTLDDTSWLRPTAHYWVRSKQPWITLPARDQIFETQPS